MSAKLKIKEGIDNGSITSSVLITAAGGIVGQGIIKSLKLEIGRAHV